MIIDDSVLKDTVAELSDVSPNPVWWKYEAEFIDVNNNIMPVHNIVSLHRTSKYLSCYTDYFFITIQVYQSVKLRLLECNRDTLKLKLYKKPNVYSGITNKVGTTYTEEFMAYLTENNNESIENKSGGFVGGREDNMGNLITISVQLVEMGLHEFKKMTAYGVYKNISPGDLLKGLLFSPLQSLSDAGKRGYDVHMDEPHNADKKSQMWIPQDVSLLDLPKHIQSTHGLYSNGLGYYLANKMWHIYPLYEFDRFDKMSRRLTIINIPKNEMVGMENTYIYRNGHLIVYATGDTKHIDTHRQGLDNTGTGFRAAKSENMVDNFAKVDSKGKVTIPPGRNTMTVGLSTREEKYPDIKTKEGMKTDNIWEDTSKILANMGHKVVVIWEQSNHNLLIPGMPVKLIYKHRVSFGLETRALKGTLTDGDTSITTSMSSQLDNKYVSTTILAIFCQREEDERPPLPQ